jgi:hypothetical protein
MEENSGAVHVLFAHIVTELTKMVSAKKIAQLDTFSAPEYFVV